MLHTCRSVGTLAAMPPPAHWRMVQTVGRVSAVTTVSSEPTAQLVVSLWESVIRWSTAVGIPLTALLTCTSRMARAAAITSPTASLGYAAAMTSSAAFTGVQVHNIIILCIIILCLYVYLLWVHVCLRGKKGVGMLSVHCPLGGDYLWVWVCLSTHEYSRFSVLQHKLS